MNTARGKVPPWLVTDDLWVRIEPLLPVRSRRVRNPGRLPLDDRLCMQGILFVLHTGIQWEWLPQELGFGSGMTCWRRLRDWKRGRYMGAAAPGAADRAASGREAGLVPGGDRRLVPAGTSGRPKTGPSPVDRVRPGSKHHVITDAHGTPLAVTLTGGTRHDVTQLLPLLDAIPHIKAAPAGPGSCSPTAATTTTSTAACCGSEASSRSSPDAAHRTAPDSAPSAGS
ncbi:IS5 family transposase [Streptomyces sp. NPDC048275]|uniref:IS5 family transposase n=1 Tax=Streptomyces sp. NPDC048275 TaxID=3155629 RepID=UPI00340AFE94